MYPVARRAKPSVRRAGSNRRAVRRLYLLKRQVNGVAQVEVVVSPLGEMPIEELLEGWRGPRRRMHAIRDGVDRVLREHAFGNLIMAHGHAIDVAGAVEGQERHVEAGGRLPGTAAQRHERGRPVWAENTGHQCHGEAVAPRGHWGMRGEDAALPHGSQICLTRGAEPFVAHAFLEQPQSEQSGVTLVHVVGPDIDVAQDPQHCGAAEAQNRLLAEAVALVAPVQLARERPVPGVVFGELRVKEVDRYRKPRPAGQVPPPRADADRAALDDDDGTRLERLEPVLRAPGDGEVGLVAIGVQSLSEVALPVEQGDASDRDVQVSRGTQQIPRQDTEPAGVRGHSRLQADLHREIGHADVGHQVSELGRRPRIRAFA